MQNLVFCFLMLISSLVIPQDIYRFQFEDNKLLYNSEDWYYIIEEESYDFYLAINMSKTDDGLIRIHSLAQFKNPQDQVIGETPISKLYSFGVLSCEQKMFYLLNDFYVDENNLIVYTENYEPGEFIVPLKGNILRRMVYEFACTRRLST